MKIFKIAVKLKLILILCGLFVISSCEKQDTIKIALSKGAGSVHYENYASWLSKINPEIEYIDLYHKELNTSLEILRGCSGIVLTGGPDAHPEKYGKGYDTARCEIDLKRDTLEYEIIKIALEKKIPILAICRGEQMLNVAMGGTLIVDIPEDFDTLISHRCPDPMECYHDVKILDNTLLSEISGSGIVTVNSNHHQAVEKLADDFLPSAYSKDGLIEAYEWKNKDENNPFMIAVQWHPERLDSLNPLSMPIGKRFIEEVIKYYLKKSNEEKNQ